MYFDRKFETNEGSVRFDTYLTYGAWKLAEGEMDAGTGGRP